MEDLKKFVDPSQLNEINGGTDTWKFNPDEFVDALENDDCDMPDTTLRPTNIDVPRQKNKDPNRKRRLLEL